MTYNKMTRAYSDMTFNPYKLMQLAVDIVERSPHPANKIAATIAGNDSAGAPYALSRTNLWPEAIEKHIGRDVRIGNSSGTLHAETACIIDAPMTKNASVFITDLPCPNCVKNMAEAGIKTIYIDHKGFDKDYAQRRGDHFANMSMRICERAGISVWKIWRREKKREAILEIPKDYIPPLENPAITKATGDSMNEDLFQTHIKERAMLYKDQPYAIAAAQDQKGAWFVISAETHPIIGYTAKDAKETDKKYTYFLEPVNRIITTAARRGLSLDPDYFYSSRIPTSRELVNMVGAGLTKIIIGKKDDARDAHALRALKQLKNAGILDIQ